VQAKFGRRASADRLADHLAEQLVLVRQLAGWLAVQQQAVQSLALAANLAMNL